ncbi:MAG: PKD domain-containing protein [Methanoregulaceae archaeon]|nr:PKD domain-containing protein [Methanoregulaceae archaeon]
MGYATLSRPEYIVVSVLPVPPVADFTANVTSGPAPLAIRFSDNSSNTPTSWSWEFGDGATSTSQNPVHTYLSEGSYTVNLTVSNTAGSDSVSKSGFIVVSEPVTPTPTTIAPQLPHMFYGIVTINGTPAEIGTNITAIVTNGGGFVITDTEGQYGNSGPLGSKLIVQGIIEEGAPVAFYADGARAECYDVAGAGPWIPTYPFESGELTELNLRVTGEAPDEPPVADFMANLTTGPVPLTIQFNDTSTNAPTSWNWNFGDGNTSTLQNPVYTYTVDGTYTVSLTAVNAAGANSTTKQNYVYAIPVIGGDKGNFLIHCNVDGAEVFFDEDSKGLISNGTLLVQVYLTAPHYTNYTVTKNGYLPITDDLPAYPVKDQTVDIFVTLDPVPPGDVYYITATAMHGGSITPKGLIPVNTGESQLFNITAYTNYAIYNILIDNQSRGPLTNYTFSDVISNHTIVAYFTATSGGGGGGGGGGSVPTTTPTTVPTTGPVIDTFGNGGQGTGPTAIPTTEITVPQTPETTATIPVPTTTVPPAQPFWSRFPLAWMIPLILVIVILAALAYYYYQRERGEELFEEK